MSNRKPYYGAARFVEIAPPGIPHRAFVNIDHITNIVFGEEREDIDVPVLDDDGNEQFVESIAGVNNSEHVLLTEKENRITGFSITMYVGGQESKFTFLSLQIAMDFYNSVLMQIHSLVPCSVLPTLKPAPAPEPKIEEAEAMTAAAEYAALEEQLQLGDAPLSDEELDALSNDDDDLPGEVDLGDGEGTPDVH